MLDIRCVRLNDSSPREHNHSQPCLTLEQYTREKNRYFTTGAIFVFLEGNHMLQTPLKLKHVSNLSLTGVRNDSSVSIICKEYIALFNATNIAIERLTFKRRSFSSPLISFDQSNKIHISNSVFLGAGIYSTSPAALYCHATNIAITNCLFKDNTNPKGEGGAILAKSETNLRLTGNNFTRNGAGRGGAICTSESSLLLEGTTMNIFNDNYCSHYPNIIRGGAVLYCEMCRVNIRGRNIFENNKCSLQVDLASVISIDTGTLTLSGVARFYRNEAKYGTIHLKCSHAQIEGESIKFVENSGGGVYISYSPPLLHKEYCFLCRDNTTYCTLLLVNNKTLISANFMRNRKLEQVGYGIIHILYAENVLLRNINSIGNNDTSLTIKKSSVEVEGANLFSGNFQALLISDSNVVFYGNTSIYNSCGVEMYVSNVSFTGYTIFQENSGKNGSAVRSKDVSLLFNGTTKFTNNTAIGNSVGGALYALNTKITMEGFVTFSFNSAKDGGAMWLDQITLILEPNTILNTSYNTASEYGGFIYYCDRVTGSQCAWNALKDPIYASNLPDCFIRSKISIINKRKTIFIQTRLISYHNAAGKDGALLYGGLLDRCVYSKRYMDSRLLARVFFTRIIQKNSLKNEVTSQPYTLCFCDGKSQCDNKSDVHVSTYRGQSFTVSVLALGQNKSITPTTVTAVISQNARLVDKRKIQQTISQNCSDLTYSIYSEENQVNLTLSSDGPCHNTGTDKVVISVVGKIQ